jgi:tetratricopeptide (TPR) repeat protein
MTDVANLLRAGYAAHRGGDLARAESLYRQGLSVAPQHATLLRLLGTLLAQSGRHAEGLPLLRQAVAANPADAEAQGALGAALCEAGQLAEARDVLTQALMRAPAGPTFFNLGKVNLAQRRYEEAANAFRQALARKPDWVEALMELGIALRSAGKLAEAEAAYRDALRLRPDDSDIWTRTGFVQREQRRYEEAEASFRRAVEIEPTSSSLIGLGDIMSARKDPAEAHEWYLRALAADPYSLDAHRRLTFSLLATGTPEKLEIHQRLRSNYVYRDVEEARALAVAFARHFPYPDEQAADALVRLFEAFLPGEIHPARWWETALGAFGPVESGRDKIVRAVLTAVYSWSVPTREALDRIAAWTSGATLASYGAGAAYWEYLLARHYGVTVRTSDLWLRHRFIEVVNEQHASAPLEPDWVVMLAWIPLGDTSTISLLDRMRPAQKLILVGEPADSMGRARLCASEAFFDRLRADFTLTEKHVPVRFSYVADTVECHIKR